MPTKGAAPMWGQLFRLSADSGLNLQGQIRQMLVAAVLDQQLPLDTPIPSSRELADHLGVARNTVVLAYQQLVDEGYLMSRQRSGHFVNPDILGQRVEPPPAARTAGAGEVGPDWAARFRFRPSEQRNIVKPSDWQKSPYPFLYGQFDPSLFPTADWRECCMKALSVTEIRGWAPDFIARDDPTLVEQIRTRVLPRRGVWAKPDEIMVTIGAQNALYLLADLLVTADTVVGIEDPGYPDARNIFSSRTRKLRPIPVDACGLTLDLRLRDCDYVYVTPSHQCPTTVTMPLDRREALLELAESADLLLIEDDYESENNFAGDPHPALKSLDRSDRVIYVGSLTKAFAPGLRMGYVVAPATLINELRALRRLMIRHPSSMVQRTFALFLMLGHQDALLRRLAEAYKQRAATLLASLTHHLPEFQAVQMTGGASCWVRGPIGSDARLLAQAAQRVGVLIEPGDVFFMSNPPPRNYFRLGFSSIALADIDAGIARLAAAARDMGTVR